MHVSPFAVHIIIVTVLLDSSNIIIRCRTILCNNNNSDEFEPVANLPSVIAFYASQLYIDRVD